jgi:hypothetical protein
MIMTIILAIILAIIAAVVTLLLITTFSTFTSAVTQQQNFIAQLKSEMVVPPVISNATGVAYFQLDMEDNKIEYSLIATDLDNAKAAHIHIGKEGEKNDTVIVTLYKPFKAPRHLGRILSVDDDITSDILEGPLAGKQLSILVNFMNNRTTYVDIHSQEYPNGELRGQISNRTSIGSSILYF